MPITTWGMTALCLVLAAALAAAAGWLWYLHRRLRYLDAVLEDILQGHMHHRALAHPSDPTARICYHCNALSIRYETQLARRQQAEEANRQMLVNPFPRCAHPIDGHCLAIWTLFTAVL